VTVHVPVPGGVVSAASAGASVPRAPGLLIAPWYREVGGGVAAVRGRFGLVHEASGRYLSYAPMCPHDALRWGTAAGWIGVDWTASAEQIEESGPARCFRWRLIDEWRAGCTTCA
jgi:hypothetical protein